MNRREMLAAGAAATAFGWAHGAVAAPSPYKTVLKKSLIVKEVEKSVLEKHAAAGFDGVEVWQWDIPEAEAAQKREVATSCGLEIHSVIRAWTNFNHADKLEADIASVERALHAARGYGAGAILLVPCRLADVAMPEAWEFDVEFDGKTGHVTRVVKGDNAPYAEYIAEQNRATDISREALKRLAPVAEKTGVLIGIENVWNNLWVTPELSAHFVRSVDSPWVQYYFDIGNHVKYSWPQEWFEALGDLIVRLHVKDFLRNPDDKGGNFVNIREGSVDWPAVRQCIEDINYSGWMTIEGSGELSYEELSSRLDLIVAGK
jgi:hexulose-6-phosphate isomerase